MRVGHNPDKINIELTTEAYHRVVIPVYIPNFEGGFKESFIIFKLCLNSLIKTSHSKTRITIYNNYSHISVKNYIDKLYAKEVIVDQVFHSKEKLDKNNTILAGVKGNLEPLVTITDSDVLFKDNWQKNVEEIFMNFKGAGMVSPICSSNSYNKFVDANWFYGFFKGKLLFENVRDTDDPLHLNKYMLLKNKNSYAVMGCGHNVVTLRRQVFDKGISKSIIESNPVSDGDSFVDLPNQNLGFLRLSTKVDFAYRIGSHIEKWMYKEYDSIKGNSEVTYETKDFINYTQLNKFNILVGKCLRKLFLHKKVRPFFLKKIGSQTKDNIAC